MFSKNIEKVSDDKLHDMKAVSSVLWLLTAMMVPATGARHNTDAWARTDCALVASNATSVLWPGHNGTGATLTFAGCEWTNAAVVFRVDPALSTQLTFDGVRMAGGGSVDLYSTDGAQGWEADTTVANVAVTVSNSVVANASGNLFSVTAGTVRNVTVAVANSTLWAAWIDMSWALTRSHSVAVGRFQSY